MPRPRHTALAGRRGRILRNDMTISEARLWDGIRRKATGARFRRQVPIGIWIVDFASLDPRLAIEVDDTSHDYRDETDRTRYIEGQGFHLLRFDNEQIAKDVLSVIGKIELWVECLRRTGRPPGDDDW